MVTRIILNGKDFRDKALHMGCAMLNQPNICSRNTCYHKHFRTIDGSCNNIQTSIKVFFLIKKTCALFYKHFKRK